MIYNMPFVALSLRLLCFRSVPERTVTSAISLRQCLTSMNTELAAFTKNQKDLGVLDCMIKRLELNGDGQLDLQEFLNLIGGRLP